VGLLLKLPNGKIIEYNNTLYFGQNKTELGKHSDIVAISNDAKATIDYVSGTYKATSGSPSDRTIETYTSIAGIPSFRYYAIIFIKFRGDGGLTLNNDDYQSNVMVSLCSINNIHNSIYTLLDIYGYNKNFYVDNKDHTAIIFMTQGKTNGLMIIDDKIKVVNFELRNFKLGLKVICGSTSQYISTNDINIRIHITTLYY